MLFPGDPEVPEQAAKAALIWSKVEAMLAQSEAWYSSGTFSRVRSVFERCVSAVRPDRHIEVYNPSSEHLA